MTYYNRSNQRRYNKVTKLLTLPDKGINATRGVGGILARLFRQMLMDFNINGSKYSSLLLHFMDDPVNNIPNNRVDRASRIGNFNKEFGKPSMSWKKFIEAVRLLQFHDDVELIIRGTSRLNGQVTEHKTKFKLGGYRGREDDDDVELIDEKEILGNSENNELSGKITEHSSKFNLAAYRNYVTGDKVTKNNDSEN